MTADLVHYTEIATWTEEDTKRMVSYDLKIPRDRFVFISVPRQWPWENPDLLFNAVAQGAD
jgi:hypothetical protein